jgi:hypothetical protein
LKVTPRHLTISTGSGHKVYDGYPLTNPTVTIGGDGFAPGEGFTVIPAGYLLDVGSIVNEFIGPHTYGVRIVNIVVQFYQARQT